MGNASRTEHMYILYTWQFSVLPRDTELTQGCTIVKDVYRSLDILLYIPAYELVFRASPSTILVFLNLII